ncbi:MAG: LytR/AlgR family response regulator transcription factor [Bacteroidota bacterium]
MHRAIIIDDEQKGIIALKQKLIDYCPGIELAGEANSGREGIQLIEQLHPDIVFLDIEMPGMDGFEMLKKISARNFHIIFTTAYDHYAIKAIKFAAFDYLLKPVDIEELKQAVEKIANTRPQSQVKKLEVLEQNLFTSPALNKIAIPTLEGLLFFDLKDITYLEAHSNYTEIHFINHQKLVASRNLKEFEELLPSDMFFRPHHSHIINLNFIKRYIRGDGGQIELQNGTRVSVSRRKKEEFLKAIGH